MKIDAFPGTLTKKMVSVPFVSKAGYKGTQRIWSWTLTAEQEAWLRKWFHRYNALRRGYFVMDDCPEQGGERYNIYYDEQTERSEKFERNLIADGFRVIGCMEDAPAKEPTEDEE